MNEIEVVQFQVDSTVSSLQSTLLRYYDALHELKRTSLFLLNETTGEPSDIEKWFRDEDFGICEDGFWQSLSALTKYRQGNLPEEAISYSCHPNLRFDRYACFQMYCHRNVGHYLYDIRSRLPGSAWIYYQGSCNIALQYPFIDQSKAITPEFDWASYHTWISVSPENNPEREIKWTSPTVDYAGEGLIISVSIPVYQGDDFVGLWSIDLPMKTLYQDYIDEKQIPEQQNFITDYQGNIIVHPIVQARIDNKKGSVYQENINSIGKDFEKIDLPKLISKKKGQIELYVEKHRLYDVFYKTVPDINWIYFSIFPKDRMIDIINNKIKLALDKVRVGDYSYRLKNMPDHVGNNMLVSGFNEMAEAIEAQHNQIIENQKRIVHSERLSAIGTLAGGIAHDFNNILSAIIGYTELSLCDVDRGSSVADNLQEVYAAGIRAKELVNQILTFARQVEEETKPIRLDGIVKEVSRLLRSSLPSTIDIHNKIKSKSSILGDPINVHQILMNLCTNAAHAMENGGVLRISLEDARVEEEDIATDKKLPSGLYIKLMVEDNGTGIPKDIIDSIFEPYFTTKPVGQGSGMGLAMVHGIVKKYKGEIMVESEIGKGSRFSVFLPITKESEEVPLYSRETLPTGSEHILFIDDEPSVAAMAEKMMARLGYKVTTRTNSIESLELFRSKPSEVDLVITDMTMPDMTGDLLAVELRKIRPDIPIILCTGFNRKMTEMAPIDLGVSAFVYKPMVMADLAKTIRKVLDLN